MRHPLKGVKVSMMIIGVLFTMLFAGHAMAAKGTVKIGYVLWDSEIASNNVVAAVLEEKMGYDVDLIPVDAGPMWASIARGDVDATIAAWLPSTHADYYTRYWQDVENLGGNLHGAKIGLVVPTYVEIDSIDELNAHKDKFGGRIVGIDPGAGIMAAADEAVDEYNLDLFVQDGSDPAMAAALSTAIRRNEWIVVTGWTPHWKFAEWDLKYLDDPKGVFGGSEWISTLVTPDLHERMPEVYEFFNRFRWTADDMAEVMVDIREGLSDRDAALKWIEANPEKVNSWIP